MLGYSYISHFIPFAFSLFLPVFVEVGDIIPLYC